MKALFILFFIVSCGTKVTQEQKVDGEATLTIVINNPAAMECLAQHREGLISTFEELDICLRMVTNQTVGIDVNGKIVGIDVDGLLKKTLCEEDPETCPDDDEEI